MAKKRTTSNTNKRTSTTNKVQKQYISVSIPYPICEDIENILNTQYSNGYEYINTFDTVNTNTMSRELVLIFKKQ